jgi:two-component system LytT family response regulator
VGECANAIEAIGAVHKLRPDVLFLDIQMPRISGLEMVGMLDPEHRPYIVFLTAFDEYAVKAFEEHAFDYLLKPIEEKRLEKRSPACARSAPCRMSRCCRKTSSR